MTLETEKEEEPPKQTEEEQEQEKQRPVLTDEETTQMWQRLNDQANQRSRTFFEFLTINDEYSLDGTGTVFKYHPVKRQEQAELLKLLKEAAALDKDTDFMQYSENIKKRACLVIEDMTPEKFEEEEYDLMENLTVAWSLKIRGFRDHKPSV